MDHKKAIEVVEEEEEDSMMVQEMITMWIEEVVDL